MRDRFTTPQEKRGLLGKDELNIADWPISVPTHQQPRKIDGGKTDLVEFVIPRENGPDQKVTLMAPSSIGLTTPIDEDVLLVLLAIAKKENFASDLVRFYPAEVFELLRWKSRGVLNYDRLEESLTRLTALTVKYELAWYDKQSQEVQPVLVTGLVSEAELIRNRSIQRGSSKSPSSYIQWRKNFYDSIRTGNLTDLDLQLYFSLERPGARRLFRHLNKRFHGHRRNQTYERDLKHLACGHLGMTDSKDLKRNFHNLITELESAGYIPSLSIEDRYRKVRPGVYRVRFDPPPTSIAVRSGGVATKNGGTTSPAADLVREFHRRFRKNDQCRPTDKELNAAGELLTKYPAEILQKALPKVITALEDAGFDALYFGGAVRFFDAAIDRHRKDETNRERARQEAEKRSREDEAAKQRGAEERQRVNKLRAEFQELPAVKREEILQIAMDKQPSDFMRDRIRKKGINEDVVPEVLEVFAASK